MASSRNPRFSASDHQFEMGQRSQPRNSHFGVARGQNSEGPRHNGRSFVVYEAENLYDEIRGDDPRLRGEVGTRTLPRFDTNLTASRTHRVMEHERPLLTSMIPSASPSPSTTNWSPPVPPRNRYPNSAFSPGSHQSLPHFYRQRGQSQSPSMVDQSEIYEAIYDTRWRLMQQEAARLQRESGPGSLSQTGTPSSLTPLGSTTSSRESSLGPSVGSKVVASLPLSSVGDAAKNTKAARNLTIQRHHNGFGFTLRHFIVYPPEDGQLSLSDEIPNLQEPMDTIFVKNVKPEGAAYFAGLRRGDRVVQVNGESVVDVPYSQVVQKIKNSTDSLHLVVVPQEDDILQIYFSEIAQNPETNRRQQTPSQSSASLRSSIVSVSHSQPASMGPANPDHVYAVPAVIREDSHNEDINQRDDGSITRMRKEIELKQEFLNRPISAFHPAAQISGAQSHPQDGHQQHQARMGQERTVPVEVHTMGFQHRETSSPARSLSGNPQRRNLHPLHEHRTSSERSSPRHQQPPQRQDFGGPSDHNDMSPYYQSEFSPSNSSQNVSSRRQRDSFPLESTSNAVRRRSRVQMTPEETEERNLRRMSYLKATKDEHVESDPEVTEFGQSSAGSNKRLPSTQSGLEKPVPQSFQKIKALFGDGPEAEASEIAELQSVEGVSHLAEAEITDPPVVAALDGIKEGWLNVKVAAIDGKRANDRSWKTLYVILKQNTMFMYRDKKTALENPIQTEEPPVELQESHLEVAEDYTKRKNVFRVKTTNGCEYLCQADHEDAMKEWMHAIEETAIAIVVDDRKDPAYNASSATNRGLRKLTSFRNRSPSVHAPVTKSRKASEVDPTLVQNQTKDKKTWKGKVAKQWKKMHHGNQPGAQQNFAEGGSIGVPLENCPMGDEPDCENVPLLVRTCCRVVEERGLEIVGVYRVPGNSAAVTYLSEQLKKDDIDEAFQLDDHRWNDVNVVSSLLKSFFRKLPDPVFCAELYRDFIESSKVEDGSARLAALKRLVHQLPEVHYKTLKHVIKHLCRVVDHSDVNKMEVRNLAIVFGPTLVRTADDNMLAMVTDMAHQCRIIESLLSHCDWFFSEDDTMLGDDLPVSASKPDLGCEEPSQNFITQTGKESVLLTNLQKLEDSGKVQSPNRDVSAKDIVTGIISAANRKMQRATIKGNVPLSPSQLALSASGGKRDYIDLMTSSSSAALMHHHQRLGTPPASGSRRNSESVIQSAMNIVAAVPHLVSGGSAHSSSSNIPSKMIGPGLTMGSSEFSDQLKPPYHKQMSVSAENMSGMMEMVDTKEDEENKPPEEKSRFKKFPIETYQGLQEATQARVKKFEDETKAILSKGHRADLIADSSSNSSNSPTTARPTKNEIDGGILLEEPYQTEAYEGIPGAPNRFLNLTYGKRRPETLVRGLSLGNMEIQSSFSLANSSSEEHDASFNTQKVASLGTLKRMKVQKAHTQPQLSLDGSSGADPHQSECDDVLSSITETFDEKLRLLLDPHYQTDSSSVQSTPVKSKNRKTSEQVLLRDAASAKSATSEFKRRSISLGGSTLQHNESGPGSSRKSDLKRGRLVDKNKEPTLRSSSNLKRNDSLTKKEKQFVNVNLRRKKEEKENRNVRNGENRTSTIIFLHGDERLVGGNKSDPLATGKLQKTMTNQRRIKRRHTVGGTKDFGEWEQIVRSHRNQKGKKSNRHRHTISTNFSPEGGSCCSATEEEDEEDIPEDDNRRVSALSAVDDNPMAMKSFLESQV